MLTKADKDRIDGRAFAEEVLRDVEEADFSDAFRIGFWREIRRRVKVLSESKSTKSIMSDERAREYGHRMVEFGKFRGKRYDDVPLDYLEWLADQGAELLSYLKSRRIRDEDIGS